MTNLKVVTIGVYGYSEDQFFQALQSHKIDTFIDIRRRRAVRGSLYAFANSNRLQNRLKALGITYLYAQELSPTQKIREVQKQNDQSLGINKRERKRLSKEFSDQYREEVLAHFDFDNLITSLSNSGAEIVALFCVEREPEACHRSLVAKEMYIKFGFEVEHIKP